SVRRLSKDGDRYVVESSAGLLEADRVIVASGANRDPKTPAFASELDPGIVQLHSSEYRSPAQLREGGVLLVGAGNSGAETGFELSRTHQTWLAGRSTGQIPVRHGSRLPFRLLVPVVRFVGNHLLTLRTPIGRKARAK